MTLGKPAVPSLLEALRAENPDATKLQVLEILEGMGPSAGTAAEPLYELLFELPGSLSIPMLHTTGELSLYSDWSLRVFKVKPGRFENGMHSIEVNDIPMSGAIHAGKTRRFLELLQRAEFRSRMRTDMPDSEIARLLEQGGANGKGVDLALSEHPSFTPPSCGQRSAASP